MAKIFAKQILRGAVTIEDVPEDEFDSDFSNDYSDEEDM